MKYFQLLKSMLSSLVLISLATSVNAFAETRKFVVTEPVHAVDSLPFYLGMKKGFFEEMGLDIELVTAEAGGQHIAAVLSGSANAYIGGPEHIAFAKVKGGEELRAVVAISNRVNAFLVAGKDVKVDPNASLADHLRGKRIAVATTGTTLHSLVMSLLNRANLDPRKDVVLIEIAAGAGQMAAVTSGQADMALLTEPMISQGVKAGVLGETVASLPRELGPFAWTTVNVPLRLIEEEPELVQSLVDATKKSLEYSFANPEEVEAIAKEEFPTLPPEDLSAILRATVDNDMWEQDGSMPPEAWKQTMDLVREIGMLNQDVPYEGVFEPKFLR